MGLPCRSRRASNCCWPVGSSRGCSSAACPPSRSHTLTEEIDPAHAARAAGTFVAGTTIGGSARPAGVQSGRRDRGLAHRRLHRRRAVRLRRGELRQTRASAARLHPVEPARRQSRRQPGPPAGRQPALAPAADPVCAGVPADGRLRGALQLSRVPAVRARRSTCLRWP